jgi:hypothetical protein
MNRTWLIEQISSDERTFFCATLLTDRWYKNDKSIHYSRLYRRTLYHMNKLVEIGILIKTTTPHNDSIFMLADRIVPIEHMPWFMSAYREFLGLQQREIPF